MGRKKKKNKRRISIISMFLLSVVALGIIYVSYQIIFADDIKWNKLEESLKEINYPEGDVAFLPR